MMAYTSTVKSTEKKDSMHYNRLNREVNHFSELARDISTMSSGYWAACDLAFAAVNRSSLLKLETSRVLARNGIAGARDSSSH